MLLAKTQSLADVYCDVWSHQTYRRYAPGLEYIDEALEALRPVMGASFIDFGCGTGKPAAELRKRGYGVVGIDFAENCLDEGIDVPFLVADLVKPLSLTAQFGFCTDVLEHVAPENIDAVLLTIADCVKQGVFFSIAMDLDEFGPMLIGKPLHLTVQNAKWWREKLGQFWPRIAVLSESETLLSVACFADVKVFREDVKIEALCNTPDDVIFSHVAVNTIRNISWVSGSEPGSVPCLIVGGGPSLEKTLPVVRQSVEMGCPVFALNAASKYLTERGIPCWQIIIDPREHNSELFDDTARGHILASQCHPGLFDRAGAKAIGFHIAMEGIVDHFPEGHAGTLIGGGITSGLTALALAYTLGYREIHLHGYDSSDADDGEAHAYPQEQSRAEKKRLDCMFNGKRYRSSFAMYKQAEEFEKFSGMLADLDTVIHVHGEGLLPAIACNMTRPRDAGHAVYDLAKCPASFDFIPWLIAAEMSRQRAGIDGPLHISFAPGPKDGFRNDVLPETDRQRYLDHVMRPALRLVGAIEDRVPSDDACWYPVYTIKPIVRMFGDGVDVPRLRSSIDDLAEASSWLDQHGLKGCVTITLREASHWPERNSNVDAWRRFADKLIGEGRRVLFIRDTEKASEPLFDYPTCPRASCDLLFRFALYEWASLNFSNAGPGFVATVFSTAPCVMFAPEYPGYVPLTDEWFRTHHGIGRGEQFPWQQKNQRIIWREDSFDSICDAWNQMEMST